eukprot:Gregarina_sp_Poly_1__5054@NODE_267_length_10370_cov_226_463457_g233_i0_p2_GENE_NODE_267_length_10370_cov_226_463457_g233_i0NODE_267_length_10370_cov_226_463457_g233_i0_p2_ORF_typecomplete_len963_score165_49TPR_15/PF13429_6/1_1e03TPR_15/PF13429_6/1_5e11TPR_15/PF13429_6/3_3e05ANAPC3/PF12895_7/2_1ANAPC3/PF12895_7/6_7e08ANAPC3/PF12895_7/1_5TPR_16/PF13432_6/0_00075TPR_16/PF13432_6/2_7e06TPR_19/PF14559_6/77TPR_19/PF14559_6/3_7e06TPR_19/PF14559_6/0_00022ChAPs/PF09295_10/87ChAPs/PF09295_10/1_3ChAPs/PF09
MDAFLYNEKWFFEHSVVKVRDAACTGCRETWVRETSEFFSPENLWLMTRHHLALVAGSLRLIRVDLASSDLIRACLVEDFNSLFNQLTAYQWLHQLNAGTSNDAILAYLGAMSVDEALVLAVFSLRLFLRLNFIGPPLSPSSADQMLPKCFSLDDIGIATRLSVEGEILQEFVHAPFALLLARLIFMDFLTEIDVPTLSVWRARTALTIQRSLTSGRKYPCASLKRHAIDNFAAWLRHIGIISNQLYLSVVKSRPVETCLENLENPEMIEALSSDLKESKQDITLVLELGTALSTYGMIDEFKALLESPAHMGFMIQLSGRLGIKREHQKDPVAQLVMKINSLSAAADNEECPTESSPEAQDSRNDPRRIALKELDPETDILEQPQFVDNQRSQILSFEQQLFALAWANVLYEISSDELTMQTIISIVRETLCLPPSSRTVDEFAEALGQKQQLMRSSNWLIYSFSLWLRSKAEFNRTKWRERSCLQMLNIEDQFKDASPSFGHRSLYAFQLDYPNIWELKLQVGTRFMKIGSTLTAKQMFEDIKMWDECVQCLRMAGRKNEALELVREKLKVNPESLALNCSLGDLTNEPGPYEQAWKLSGSRYSRAARSLGRVFFEKQDLNSAIDWFKKALDLQPMMPATQFTYGCCLMKIGEFGRALDAFAIVTALEPQQAEAWANMASIHTAQQNWESAKKCIAQAARLGQHLWRVWDNYAKISIKTNDVYGVLEALEHIVKLGKADSIEIWVLNFVARSLVLKHEVLESQCEALGDCESNGSRVKQEGLRAGFKDLLQRSLNFFKDFFFSYSHSLPSDPSFVDPIKSCVDRYRIWTVVTDMAGLVVETWEIRLRQLRHLMRVTEDVCKNGKSDNVTDDVAVCLELLGRSFNEIWSLKSRLPKQGFAREKMLTDFERFVHNINERFNRAIADSSAISEPSAKLMFQQELASIIKQAVSALESSAGEED